MTKLKLYADPNSIVFSPTHKFNAYDLFARLEQDKWEFVYDLAEADVIPCIMDFSSEQFVDLLNEKVKKDQILLILNLFHSDDHMTHQWMLNLTQSFNRRFLIVHSNNYITDDPKCIFYDIMLNRQKFYMFDMDEDFSPEDKIWTHCSKREYYSHGPIAKCLSNDDKKILCLNRLGSSKYALMKQQILRRHLNKIFTDSSDVYLSDPHKNVFFYPNGYNNDSLNVRPGGTWYPAADIYYNTSYVSVYIESVIDSLNTGDIFCASEKTYDPLFKGNFILPFSSPNFIQKLQDWYGFKFPNWINYSYDSVFNFNKRLLLYLEAVNEVHHLSLDALHQHYIDNRDILEYNRNRIKEIPYSTLYDKVVDSAKYFGWL